MRAISHSSTYLLYIMALVDSLISISTPITSQGHLDVILEGLPKDYKFYVIAINNRVDP